MFWRIWFFLTAGILYCLNVKSQVNTGTPLKQKSITIQACDVQLDSMTLMPHSVIVTINADTITQFSIENHTIKFSDSLCAKLLNQLVHFRYRTFNFDIGKPFFMIDTAQWRYQERAIGQVIEYRPTDNKNAIIDAKGLDYRGSFSRGISIGNSQSLVLNSNFDMQLIGDLGNGLKVVAAISDENLPIQAQGNTQQLQEFDKVFIQVSKDRTSLTAGDYELRKPDSYFMHYFKKLKGITLSSTYNVNKKIEAYSKGSFAISRGKFARQTLPTREGNQGPYRLQGNNGERFIIVLAGTERVFFNGILLTRGFDYDYVIDYNRAEITFSPTRIVARDSRVIIDFEYTDINYLRSLYAAETSFIGERWKAGIHMYSEQDSKNVTGDQQLDSIDIKILASSGDDFTKSVRRSFRTVNPDEKNDLTRILYRGETDPEDPSNLILFFTENLDSAKYTAVFSEVGIGKGDYIIDNTKNKNARVYKYVGRGMGTYLPVIQLIPPEKKQLITANAAYKFSKNTDIFAELALSNLDVNRRSLIDNEDNTGLASNVAISHAGRLDSAGLWSLKANLKHEYLHQHFNPLNPFRPPEFSRDWNISMITAKAAENLLISSVQLSSKSGFMMEYGFNRYEKGNLYSGNKHSGTLTYQNGRLAARAFSTFLNSGSSALDQTTSFRRPNIVASYKLLRNKNWMIGAEYDGESNILKGYRTDTLKKSSYEYNFIKGFITSDVSRDFSIKVAFSSRNDYFAKIGQLEKASNAKELELAGKWLASANSDLSWSITGRDLSIIDQDLLPNDKSKKTILGRLDYVFSAINQGIRSTTTYNTSSGQEPKIEYVFRKVEVGQGDYFLINETENPNLSNVQDFRYDPTNPLSSYIRLSLTNNEFVRTNNLELNQSLTIDPSKFKQLKEGVKLSKSYKFFSKFSTLSNFRISKKQMANVETPLISYLDFSLRDTSLVAYSALNTNTLFFNKGNVKFDVQLGNRNNQNRIIQVSGREDRGLDEYFIRSRLNLRNNTDLFFHIEKSKKSYQSEVFADRDLDIDIYRLRPEISFRPSQNTRWIGKYSYQQKEQQILTRDKATIHDITSEFTYRKANQYSFDVTISYVNINFSGIANSPIEYDMLEGLKNGKNFLWNLLFTKRIAKNIDLTINYEGRKTGASPTVNVGRAQVKATF